jgi:hypothetical protein
MAYGLLVATELTQPLIEAGSNLLHALDDAGIGICTAFWLLNEESGWRLRLASPLVEEQGAKHFYSTIRPHLAADSQLTLAIISAARPGDSTVQLIKHALRMAKNPSGTRITGNVVKGVFIPDAYVYRTA